MPSYTLRSSSDPRGRLRGGVAGRAGEAVAAPLGSGGAIGAATVGVVRMRACCTSAGRAGANWGEFAVEAAGAGLAAALAIPMNVAGDNMTRETYPGTGE